MADKKYRILQDNRRYGEMEVEWENGVRLILTDAKSIYHDDYNSIKGWVVDCMNEDGNEFIPEYLYSLSFMPDGYSLITYIVNEDVANKVITDYVINILHHGSDGLKKYLEELHNKLPLAERR